MYLAHHGVLGMKWGVRRYQNVDGTLTEAGKRHYNNSYKSDDKVFISGKVSYDEPLNSAMKQEVNRIIKSNAKVLIGDAPGADTRVQQYLADKNYRRVVVYTTDPVVRNNIGHWEVKRISNNGETDERAIRRQKDIAMTTESTKGFAIMPEYDKIDSAMSLNVQRMLDNDIPVRIFDYKKNRWV